MRAPLAASLGLCLALVTPGGTEARKAPISANVWWTHSGGYTSGRPVLVATDRQYSTGVLDQSVFLIYPSWVPNPGDPAFILFRKDFGTEQPVGAQPTAAFKATVPVAAVGDDPARVHVIAANTSGGLKAVVGSGDK